MIQRTNLQEANEDARGANGSARARACAVTREALCEIAAVSLQCDDGGSDVASVCAAVFVRVVGTAPPSSSHRCISRRGSLWRSRCLRRSSDTPRITAPIDKSPTVQFIAMFPIAVRPRSRALSVPVGRHLHRATGRAQSGGPKKRRPGEMRPRIDAERRLKTLTYSRTKWHTR